MSPALVHLDVPTQDFVIIPIFLVNRQLSIPIDLFFFFPFLPQADRMDRKERGRGRECWKGFQGSVPAIRADVKCSAPHRERHFSFYRTVDNIQGIFI